MAEYKVVGIKPIKEPVIELEKISDHPDWKTGIQSFNKLSSDITLTSHTTRNDVRELKSNRIEQAIQTLYGRTHHRQVEQSEEDAIKNRGLLNDEVLHFYSFSDEIQATMKQIKIDIMDNIAKGVKPQDNYPRQPEWYCSNQIYLPKETDAINQQHQMRLMREALVYSYEDLGYLTYSNDAPQRCNKARLYNAHLCFQINQLPDLCTTGQVKIDGIYFDSVEFTSSVKPKAVKKVKAGVIAPPPPPTKAA